MTKQRLEWSGNEPAANQGYRKCGLCYVWRRPTEVSSDPKGNHVCKDVVWCAKVRTSAIIMGVLGWLSKGLKPTRPSP